MICFVTGGSGFVGANLIRELVAKGHQVRALFRRGSENPLLKGVPFERVEGDLSSQKSLEQRMRGVDWCFHAAASYRLWMRDYSEMYASNVEGTKNALQAAGAAGCSRIVYTSTVGCIALPRKEGGAWILGDEETPVWPRQMTNHYKRSKWQAEQVARHLAQNGWPVVIVNPSAPVGPGDSKPTPTGQIIVDFLNRRMPAYLDTGLNWVHVRDVAVGHILAAEKGRAGERYILGNREGNWTMKQTLKELAEVSGVSAPLLRIPYVVAWMAALVNEGLANVTGKPPKAPLAGVRMAKYKMFFKTDKAVNELRLPQTPVRQAFKEAVEWFIENGYVTRKRR